ncbi:unnamed protein product [Durusdinium trenchii]|uniref:Cyclin-dependent kinase 2 homolog n=3 Tax=Durusdinium trenchii TaxID=1381693 RepID=A0ABP0J979_9DINO
MALVMQPPIIRDLPRVPTHEVDTFDEEHLCGRYVLLEKIGGGSYGSVTKMEDVVTGKLIAIKSSPLFIEEGISASLLREIVSLRACQHPNVVQLLDVHHDSDCVHLILEFMPFNLSQYMRTVLKGPFVDLKPAFRQILLGVAHCHRCGYLHRDLKPQNILVNGDDKITLKVADFGLAKPFSALQTRRPLPFTRNVVTLWYRAPELMLMDQRQCMYDQSVDVWSLGCILAEMATKRPLFPGDSEIDMLFKIFRMKGTPTATTWPNLEKMGHFSPQFPSWQDTKFQRVLESCEAKNHSFLQRMFGALLEYVPRKRLSASRILSHQCFEDQYEQGEEV